MGDCARRLLLRRLPALALLALSVTAPAAAERPGGTVSPEAVATTMLAAASAKEPTFESAMKIPQEIMKAALAEWFAAFTPLLEEGEKPNGTLVIQMLWKTDELYRDGSFRSEESSRFAARIKAISRAELASWVTAVQRFDPSSDKYSVVWFLIRSPALFQDSTIRPTVADLQLRRLRDLPEDAVSRWAESLHVGKGPAAFALIRVDALFTGTVFQPAVFDAAFPRAKELLVDRSQGVK